MYNYYYGIPDGYSIYQTGVKERSGRYPWGSGDRPYQRLEKRKARIERRTARITKGITRKLDRADDRTKDLQKSINKKFAESARKQNSRFAFIRKSGERAFNVGYKTQEKRERIEYRTSKSFERYTRRIERMDQTMDSVLKSRGVDYYNRVTTNNNARFTAAMARKLGAA